MNIMQTTLKPVDQIADLARLCARIATPFTSTERVLLDAGVSPGQLDEARSRWRASILSDPGAAQQFRDAYAKERARIRGEAEPISGRTPALSETPLPAPERVLDVDETAFGARLDPEPALPFAKGDFKPEPSPVDERRRQDAFDPDSTLPLSGSAERDPTTPFIKLLLSKSHKKGTR